MSLQDESCIRDWVLDDSDWSAEAWMSDLDASLYKRVLARLAARLGRPVRCFEWGAGLSTYTGAGLLQDKGALGSWCSVEYDRAWLSRFIDSSPPPLRFSMFPQPGRMPSQSQLVSRISFLAFDYGELRPMEAALHADSAIDMSDYVSSVRGFDDGFDFILVDGRKRNRCMYEAAKMVSDSGLVLLHDAWRPYYSLSSTFFKTAVRVGHNLLVASNQGLGHLLEFFDVSEVGHPQQVNWVSE